jgi:hypothetical protein
METLLGDFNKIKKSMKGHPAVSGVYCRVNESVGIYTSKKDFSRKQGNTGLKCKELY